MEGACESFKIVQGRVGAVNLDKAMDAAAILVPPGDLTRGIDRVSNGEVGPRRRIGQGSVGAVDLDKAMSEAAAICVVTGDLSRRRRRL
jgi:hypothetical protein